MYLCSHQLLTGNNYSRDQKEGREVKCDSYHLNSNRSHLTKYLTVYREIRMYKSTSTTSYQVISSEFHSYFSPSTNSATSSHLLPSIMTHTDEQTHSTTNFRLKATQKNRNERERARVRLLNIEMDKLKSRIPTIHHKTTKLQTLRHAILYIKYLQHLQQYNKNIGSQKTLS